MFCPKCGVENPDGAQLCSSCSWVLTSISTIAPAPDARTSGLAVASLVLAILSIPTLFITAIPALIFGIVGLVKIEKSQGRLKGKGLAIAGVAVPGAIIPFFAIFLALMLPALASARAMSQRTACFTNLKQLGLAMHTYAAVNDGKYPPADKWCDLLIKYADVNERTFRCAGAFGCSGTRCCRVISGKKLSSYALNKNIEKLGENAPPDMVLLFETMPGWNRFGGPEILSADNHNGKGCNILFNDGHVAFVKTEDLNDLKWTAK
jgi:prepilin-type processing-associated H-X9-DG protein